MGGIYVCAKSQLLSYSSYYCTGVWHWSRFKCVINAWAPGAQASSAKSETHHQDFIFDFLVPLPLYSCLAICHSECPQSL